MKIRPRYNKKGWPLCQCKTCGRCNYVEPHGTTAPCRCSHGEWVEHESIPFAHTAQTFLGEYVYETTAVEEWRRTHR